MTIESIPMAPGGHGWSGHNGDFREDRMGTLARIARDGRPLLRLRLPVPGVETVVVNDPDLIGEMLVKHGRLFDKSIMLRFSLQPLAGEGLFTSNGELWRRQRKLMAPMFQPRALERYADDMVQCAQRTVDSWRDGREVRLHDETTRLTMSVAGKTLFDAETFSEADRVGQALAVALEWAGWMLARPYALLHVLAHRGLRGASRHVPPWAASPLMSLAGRFERPLFHTGERGRALVDAIAILDEHVAQMIAERRRAPAERNDLLTRLLEAQREDGGATMDDKQVRDEILTLFVAGHETTASGLAWTVDLLCRHPAIYQAVQAEVDALPDDPTAADLPRLGLCLRSFQEALRLYPPVYMFGRDATEDVTIGGHDIPTGTNTLVSPWALHRLPQLWPDPERFDPSRFTAENEAKRHRFAYLPFGAGPRICIGNHFAYMEAQLALAVMLRRYDFERLGADEPEPGATLRPARGIAVRLRARRV
jgi:cytochrome P450